jgi:hypothetical protein
MVTPSAPEKNFEKSAIFDYTIMPTANKFTRLCSERERKTKMSKIEKLISRKRIHGLPLFFAHSTLQASLNVIAKYEWP